MPVGVGRGNFMSWLSGKHTTTLRPWGETLIMDTDGARNRPYLMVNFAPVGESDLRGSQHRTRKTIVHFLLCIEIAAAQQPWIQRVPRAYEEFYPRFRSTPACRVNRGSETSLRGPGPGYLYLPTAKR